MRKFPARIIKNLVAIALAFILTTISFNLNPQPKPVLAQSPQTFNYDFDSPPTRPPWNIVSGNPPSYLPSSAFGSPIMQIEKGANLELPLQINLDNLEEIYEVSFKFYDYLDTSEGFLFGLFQDERNVLAAGINTIQSTDEYFYRINLDGVDSYLRTGIKRTNGIHTLMFRVTPKGSYLVIDGINLSFLPWNGKSSGVQGSITRPAKLVLRMPWDLGDNNHFDDLKLEKAGLYSDLLSRSPADIEKYYALLLVNQYPELYQDAGSMNDRSVGGTGLAYAFKARVEKSGCSADRNTETTDCDKARKLFNRLTDSYSSWGQKWLSPATDHVLALGSWLIWDQLDTNTKEEIANTLDQEFNYYHQRLENVKNHPTDSDPLYGNSCTYLQGFSRFVDDTSCEDNGVAAMFLGVFANMFESLPDFTNFSQSSKAAVAIDAKTYGFHVATNNETDSYYGITSRTVNQRDGLNIFDNHHYSPSLNYSGAMAIPGFLYPAYTRNGQSLPDEYFHNQAIIWNDLFRYYDTNKFIWKTEGNPKICTYTNINKFSLPSPLPTCIPTDQSPGQLTNPKPFCIQGDGNIFAKTGRDDWGGDLTWFNHIFAIAAKIFPTEQNQQFYTNLLKHEIYLRPDYLAFPQNDLLKLYMPLNLTGSGIPAYYDQAGKSYFKDQNTGLTSRHITAYLIHNPNLLPGKQEGDLNNDGQVNSQDLVILLQNWGSSPANPRVDLNSDGVVNGMDFEKLRKLIK